MSIFWVDNFPVILSDEKFFPKKNFIEHWPESSLYCVLKCSLVFVLRKLVNKLPVWSCYIKVDPETHMYTPRGIGFYCISFTYLHWKTNIIQNMLVNITLWLLSSFTVEPLWKRSLYDTFFELRIFHFLTEALDPQCWHCIAGYVLSQVIQRILSEILFWEPWLVCLPGFGFPFTLWISAHRNWIITIFMTASHHLRGISPLLSTPEKSISIP